MSKFLILGDPHLGKGLSIGKTVDGLNSRVQDQVDLLNWTYEKAKEHQVKSIIVTGDVYQEPRPHPAIIKIFMQWLMKCVKDDINVHIIAGNHDIIRTGSSSVSALDIIPVLDMPNINVYKDFKTIDYLDDNISFTLIPYRDRIMYDCSSLPDALEKYKIELERNKPRCDFRICIGHTAITGSLYVGDEVDNVSNEIFCDPVVFKNYDYTWMGHIHHPQVLSENPYVAHIGSMDRSDFGTTETKYDKILILIDSDKKSFEKIILPNRPLRHFKISVPEDKNSTEFVINSLFLFNNKNNLENSILKIEVELQGSVENTDRKKISSYAYDRMKVFNISHFGESRNVNVVSADKHDILNIEMGEESAIKAYIETLNIESEEEKNLCLDISFELLSELRGKK